MVAAVSALVVGAACDLPILHPGPTPACGWYPVYCNDTQTQCCPEGDRCVYDSTGTIVCEFDGNAGASFDAGASQ